MTENWVQNLRAPIQSTGGAGSRDVDWNALSTSALQPCLEGHEVDNREGHKPVAYLDGAIVGYCRNCGIRMSFPKIYGGLAVAFLKAVCGELLSGEFDPTLMGQLAEAMYAVEEDKREIDSALETGRTVKEIVAHRMRDV